MKKWIRIAFFALPFAGGAAFAQGSGTSGSSGAPGQPTPPVTNDTRTPMQEKAGRIDDTTPVLPGDATKPVDVPNTVRDSNKSAMPPDKAPKRDQVTPPAKGESALPKKPDALDDSSQTRNKVDSDVKRDQLDSDK